MKRIFMASILAAVTTAGFAQKPSVVTDNQPGWRKIGETTASFKEQDESIVVLGADEFSALKLKVNDAGIEIERLQVFYESGDMEEIDVKNTIQAGDESRTINLKHSDRDIKKVAFTYKSLANSAGEKAEVELHGLKSDNQDSEAYRKADEAEETAEDAADEVKDEAREVGRDAERATEKAEEEAEDVADEVKDESREAEREAEKAEREAERDAEKAAKEAEREAERAEEKLEDEADTTESKLRQTIRESEEDLEQVDSTLTEVYYDAKREIKKEIREEKNDAEDTEEKIEGAVEADRVNDKLGPDGQVIYKDKRKYYYLNDEGQRVYITKSQLKDNDN